MELALTKIFKEVVNQVILLCFRNDAYYLHVDPHCEDNGDQNLFFPSSWLEESGKGEGDEIYFELFCW